MHACTGGLLKSANQQQLLRQLCRACINSSDAAACLVRLWLVNFTPQQVQETFVCSCVAGIKVKEPTAEEVKKILLVRQQPTTFAADGKHPAGALIHSAAVHKQCARMLLRHACMYMHA